MGRTWLFGPTEPGAHQVGIMQSLIVTCRLHPIDPYTYPVDALPPVGQHPAAGARIGPSACPRDAL